jgi:hypothetical protein
MFTWSARCNSRGLVYVFEVRNRAEHPSVLVERTTDGLKKTPPVMIGVAPGKISGGTGGARSLADY